MVEYRGYEIEHDEMGFYLIRDPLGRNAATCEGLTTAREIVDEKIAKIYGWYDRTSHLSPLVARAAGKLSNADAELILAAKSVGRGVDL